MNTQDGLFVTVLVKENINYVILKKIIPFNGIFDDKLFTDGLLPECCC
jgi:hypothetical protein